MNGIITKAAAGACGAALLVNAGGCYTYHDLVDTCYPQRYEQASRDEVRAFLDPQAQNGHILDQTVWSCFFEAGTDKLNAWGMAELNYLAQRRPGPDTLVFLQTAQDAIFDPGDPGRYALARTELDRKRETAIKNYLSGRTAGRNLDFQVVVHDPPEQNIAGQRAMRTMQGMYNSAKGSLAGAGGGAGATSGTPGAGGGTTGGTTTGAPPMGQ